ncbi:MAG: tRNA dihydrouridine synthase DusB [Actinomycetota bacterium]
MTTPGAASQSSPYSPSGASSSGLVIGPHRVESPVVLAPMAGITNAAFRRLCREQTTTHVRLAGVPERGHGLFVGEMVTSRALVEGSAQSLRLVTPGPGEFPRSVQLYGVDPVTMSKAVQTLLQLGQTDHIDLNFGCPVPKVTRRGGGAALPWKLMLFRDVVRAAVRTAAPAGVPVTVKMRIGIDEQHQTFLEAGRIAEDEGVAAVALHARTAEQHYSGAARWDAIAELKNLVRTVPVLGNGDIWSADDALAMVHHTGCDGVVVGRGCLGRPWLFADLMAAFTGATIRVRPSLGTVLTTLRRHVELLIEHYIGHVPDPEQAACRDIRKHVAWYLKGFAVQRELRAALATVGSLTALDAMVATMDATQPWPGDAAEGARGRAGTPQRRVALPDNWLLSRDVSGAAAAQVLDAELSVSGG